MDNINILNYEVLSEIRFSPNEWKEIKKDILEFSVILRDVIHKNNHDIDLVTFNEIGCSSNNRYFVINISYSAIHKNDIYIKEFKEVGINEYIQLASSELNYNIKD